MYNNFHDLEYEMEKLLEELKYTAKNSDKYIEIQERVQMLQELIRKNHEDQLAILKYIH